MQLKPIKTTGEVENIHRRTHRWLANRYMLADDPHREFYKKMMDMNDCRMIEQSVMLIKRSLIATTKPKTDKVIV